MNPASRVIALLDGLTGRLIHGLWLGLVLGAAFAVNGQQGASAGAALGWTLLALPGVAGLLLAGPRDKGSEPARLLLILSWTLPCFVATIALGSVLSAASLLFLTGPAAIAASCRQREVLLSSLVNGVALLVLLSFAIAGPFVLINQDLAQGAPVLLLAGFLAVCALTTGLRLSRHLARARGELQILRPVAEAFEHAPVPLLAVNPEGEVTAASSAVRRLIPGAPRRLSGLPLTGFAFDDEGRTQVEAGLRAGFEAGAGRAGPFVFSVRDAKGAPREVTVQGQPGRDALVLHLEPEDWRTQALVRVTEERDEARAASHAKSEFIASVSHELRTPLNAIIGFSDVMKQRLFGPMPARYAEYGDLIHESGVHLLDLIGDVLDMSKIEADRYELVLDEFDARDVVATATKMLRLRAEESGLVLTAAVGDEPIMVRADRKALRQILLNLISNAVKFTPTGGAVAVMVRAQGEQLVLAVGDSGVGIAADELDSLGSVFTQTRSARGSDERGSGLGLSLVRALAEMHGGAMSVQSREGEGTTVTIRLPVILAPKGEIAPFEPLEVHERIRKAQDAGALIAQTVKAS